MYNTLLGGIMISLGAMFFLITGKSLAFTLGILGIVSLELSLITGFIPMAVYKEEKILPRGFGILIGNIMGSFLSGLWIVSSPKANIMVEKIDTIVATKSLMSPMNLVFSGAMTGALIGIGVIAYNKQNKNLLGLLMLIMSVTAFVELGSDHVVANAFYATASSSLAFSSGVKIILFPALGNILGGIFIASFISFGGKENEIC